MEISNDNEASTTGCDQTTLNFDVPEAAARAVGLERNSTHLSNQNSISCNAVAVLERLFQHFYHLPELGPESPWSVIPMNPSHSKHSAKHFLESLCEVYAERPHPVAEYLMSQTFLYIKDYLVEILFDVYANFVFGTTQRSKYYFQWSPPQPYSVRIDLSRIDYCNGVVTILFDSSHVNNCQRLRNTMITQMAYATERLLNYSRRYGDFKGIAFRVLDLRMPDYKI